MKYRVAPESLYTVWKIIENVRLKQSEVWSMNDEDFMEWSGKNRFCIFCYRTIPHSDICPYCHGNIKASLDREYKNFMEEIDLRTSEDNKLLLSTFTPFSHHYLFEDRKNSFVRIRENNIEGFYFEFDEKPDVYHEFNLRYDELNLTYAINGLLYIAPSIEENVYTVLAIGRDKKAERMINMRIIASKINMKNKKTKTCTD